MDGCQSLIKGRSRPEAAIKDFSQQLTFKAFSLHPYIGAVIRPQPNQLLESYCYPKGMSGIPKFHQLTPDSRPWRIDWFGEVGYPGAVRRYAQPSLKVAISPLHESALPDASATVIHSSLEEQRCVWMSIGSLPMLRIGDVWQQGKLAVQPAYLMERFPNLDIGPGSSMFIKAGLSIGDAYLLPFAEHPWHRQHTHSYCVAVEVSDGVTLVIPGAEMIRFYFGSCSILVHRLFTKPFQEEGLIREKHYDPERKHLHLKLADGIPRFAVPDLGRIATDEEARRAAASIYEHCVKATSQGEQPYPYMGFPFRGKTTLQASGMWLPFGEEANRTFLAFRLRSCSHRFAFDSLTYDPCQKASWRRSGDSPQGDSEDPQKQVFSVGQKSCSTLVDSDPGTKKSLRHFVFGDSARFPDLRHKSIRLREIVAGNAKQVLIRHGDGTLEPVAFDEPEGSNDVRAVNACADFPGDQIELPDEHLPKFMREGMASLRKENGNKENFVIKLLVPFGEPYPVFPLPMVVDEDGVVDQAFLYSEPDGHQRMCRAGFVGLFRGETEIRKAIVIEGEQVNSQPLVKEAASLEITEVIRQLVAQDRL